MKTAYGAVLAVWLVLGIGSANGQGPVETGLGPRDVGMDEPGGRSRFMARGMAGAGAPAEGQEAATMQEALMARILTNPKTAEKVGLKEDQIKTLKDALYALKRSEIDLRAKMEHASLDQAKLIEEKADDKAVMDAVDKKYEVMKEMAKLKIKNVLLVRKTLTSEQIEKIKGLVEERLHEMREMRRGSPEDAAEDEEARQRKLERLREWRRGAGAGPAAGER